MVYSLVFGVGENMAHQLSNDSLERISTPKEILRLRGEIIQHVACGDKFTILTTTKDHCEFPQLYVIGDNDYGQLSLGHFRNATSWTNVTIGIKVKQLICGDYHTIALSQDGEVFSCGRSDKYQLGLTNQSPQPLAEFKKLKLNEKIKLIACGTNHSIFVTENNEIFGCGDNSYFQLGSKKKDVFKKPEKLKLDFVKGKGIKGVSCGYQHTIYLTEEGNIFCFGNNTFGQLNINLVGLNKAGEGQTISKIECGSYHTICCTDKGQVWGCGKNRNGELGVDNDGSNVDVVTKIKLENNVKIENVVVGNHHSVMVASDNRLFSCGKNTGGQLGLGHLEKVYKVNELKLPFPVKVLAAGGYHSVFCCEVSNDMAEDIETQTIVFQNINLQGAWKENSGKLWYCKQKVNTFKWTQVDSNREAKGVIVGNPNALQNFGEEEPCSIYITFDESVHWKLTPSVDFNYLIGPKDTFVRVYQKKPLQAKQVVESLRGTEFIENSGKIWSVTHVNESSIQLLNKHDGRVAEGHFVKDEWSGKYVVYINFHNYDGDDLLRIETNDWNTLILSNDDVFKRLL